MHNSVKLLTILCKKKISIRTDIDSKKMKLVSDKSEKVDKLLPNENHFQEKPIIAKHELAQQIAATKAKFIENQIRFTENQAMFAEAKARFNCQMSQDCKQQ